MPDSAQDKPQVEEKPTGVTTLVIANHLTKDGVATSREVQKDEKGRFIKKVRPLPPTIEFTRMERKALLKAEKAGDETEYMKSFMNLVRISQYDGKDPKGMMAAVKAFEVIRGSALGKIAPSEQEMDKLTTQPVRVVIVTAPQLMHPEVQEDKRLSAKTKPSFIDAEVVQQN